MNIPDPQTFIEPEKLRKLMANAVRLGYPDLAFGCQFRIAELAGNAHGKAFEGPAAERAVERLFWIGLVTAEELRTADNGRTTRLIKVRAKHKRVGAVRLLSDLMMTAELSDGFEKLVANNRSDLTGEAIVVSHEDLFSIDAVNAARKKLMDQGVTLSETAEA
ncbi:hypothetical protein [Devosia sp. A449]